MPLSLDAIEQIINAARGMGFSAEQLNGIRAQLLIRSAQPDGATKLELALDQMPRSRRDTNSEFLAQMDALGESVLARGRGVLEGMSDEEWGALLEDDEEPEAGAVSGA